MALPEKFHHIVAILLVFIEIHQCLIGPILLLEFFKGFHDHAGDKLKVVVPVNTLLLQDGIQ
jgi:hypothetical protein